MRKLLIMFGFLLGIALIGEPLAVAAQTGGKAIKMEIKSEKLTTSLKRLEKTSGYKILFSYDDLSRFTVTNKSINTHNISQALDLLLTGTPLKYEVDGQFVNVYLSEGAVRTAQLRPSTDGTKIKGRVLDIHGDPVVGAVVRDNRHKVHTTTDIDGLFTLVAPEERVNISVSFLGMRPTTWTGRRSTFANVVMEDADNALEDVVVTGYQVLDKRASTSAITSIKAEDILRPDALSIDQMLEGRIPDMMFMSNSGESGVAPKIRIRGTSSIIGNREPLWVVDGIVVNDPVPISAEDLNDPDYVNRIGNAISGLNPQDIERLDILKDASATALYGTKAANGVIVITTKRGREGKPQIRYNNNFTFKIRPRYSDRSVDVMNSKERIQLSRELFADKYEYNPNSAMVGYEGLMNQLYKGEINDAQFAKQLAYLETINTDWFDLLTNDSFSQQHTVSMNGGTERGTYYASVGYTDNDDVVKGTTNKRYSALLNLDTKFTDWLSASFGMKGNVNSREYYQDSNSPVEYAYTTSRAIPAYTTDGDYYYYGKLRRYSYPHNFNIINELNNSGIKQDGSAFTLDANLRFRFNDWITANAIASYTTQNTETENYWGDRTWYAAELRNSEYGETAPENSLMPQGGQLTKQHVRQNAYTVRLQLDWNKYFGEDDIHNFSGGVGFEANSVRVKGYQNTARGYFPDRGMSFVTGIDLDKYTNYKAWMSENTPVITDSKSNTLSAYATVSYNWKRMIFVNANARVDGSNNFGDRSNDKLLPIWSVSASFDASKLGFIKDIDWIDFLTVKTSYGFQGNMLSDQSPVMIIRKKPMNDYYGEFTSSVERNPNPNLKWERTNSYNLGLEMSFLQGRIQFEGSLYFKRTKDAFMTKNISTVNGYSSYVVNGGNISNDGYSVALTFRPIQNKDWQWSITGSFSRTINSVETLPAGEEYSLNNFLNGTAIVKGKSVGTFYSYRFLGLSPVDGGPMFDDWFDHYEDLVGLNKYDTYTRVLAASGSREPFMQGSLNTMLRYKSLRVSANFVYSLGAKTRMFGMYGSTATGDGGGIYASAGEIRPENNLSRDYLDRWMKPGDELHTNIPAIISQNSDSYFRYLNHWSPSLTDSGIQEIADSYWDMYDYSDLRVASADYLKLSSLSVSYELPKEWIKRYGVSRLELTASGSNLFTLSDSKLKGQTPTQGGFTTIQLSDRPSFSFGLNVTF